MTYHVKCFLIGEAETFLVPIDPNALVGSLKIEIKKTRHPTLDNIDPYGLRLYLAEIDHPLNMQERIDKLIQASQNLDKCKALVDIEQDLPEILGGGVQGQYIIVRIPDGESFNLRACGEVPSSLWPR